MSLYMHFVNKAAIYVYYNLFFIKKYYVEQKKNESQPYYNSLKAAAAVHCGRASSNLRA
jgi:hypothetical protein